MKKIIFTLFCFIAATSSAFAAQITTAGTSLGTQKTPFKASSKVKLYAVADASNYSIVAQHDSAANNTTKGGKQFGSTSNDPAVTEHAAGAAAAADVADPLSTPGTQAWIQ